MVTSAPLTRPLWRELRMVTSPAGCFFLKGVEGAGNNQCTAYSLHFHCLGIKLARRNKPGTDCHKQNDSADNNIDMRILMGLRAVGRMFRHWCCTFLFFCIYIAP